MGIKNFSLEFKTKYPEIAKKLSDFYKRSCCGPFPAEQVLLPVEPDASADLLEEISKIT